MTHTHFPFQTGPLDVRDYECDLQGVVNNAVYLNYLEHARHQGLLELGLDFAALHEQGCDLVVTRSEVDYRQPLRSGDQFLVRTRVSRASRIRFAFDQVILRAADEQVMIEARIVGTGIIQTERGTRPGLPQILQDKLDEAGLV
ncbi:MAG: acyl-CoA thioesterase [Gemmatimonadetes bacterium]|jgi:acyl-CoA thioester hydrolase|nr:acyl-CoA thioesterase [Gemmatimonadota bacterium]MBT6146065.1 acyl-CoA thioesterase [Gemmatimonadota bacterium]MBT7863576.1 acyl-CoA thioesterase [Gemmatimonadota bacterium]